MSAGLPGYCDWEKFVEDDGPRRSALTEVLDHDGVDRLISLAIYDSVASKVLTGDVPVRLVVTRNSAFAQKRWTVNQKRWTVK